MKSLLNTCLAITAVVVLVCGCVSTKPQTLKKKETIVFLGDSITAYGGRPGGYVDLVKKGIAAAYPDRDIKVINAGISGHRVPHCQKRLQRDVLSKNPSIVVIYIGINDVWHWSKHRKGTTKADFESGLKDMIAKINAAGARVILCTPTVIGEKTDNSNKYDKMLDEYAAISHNVATETGAGYVDLRGAFQTYLKEHNKKNAKKGILTRDSVHLNKNGNRFLADLMLKALHVPVCKK